MFKISGIDSSSSGITCKKEYIRGHMHVPQKHLWPDFTKPCHTSGKIKLYTTALLVLTLSITTQGWLNVTDIFSEWCGKLKLQFLVLWRNQWYTGNKRFLCGYYCISATKEPAYSPVIQLAHVWISIVHFEVYLLYAQHISQTLRSTCETTLTGQIFDLVW